MLTLQETTIGYIQNILTHYHWGAISAFRSTKTLTENLENNKKLHKQLQSTKYGEGLNVITTYGAYGEGGKPSQRDDKWTGYI